VSSSARTIADVINFDWGALAVFVGLYAPAFVAIRQGYVSPDSFQQRYARDRASAKSGLASDEILPALTDLVLDVNSRALGTDEAGEELDANVVISLLNDRGVISSTLDSAGYLGALDRVSQLYSHYAQLDELVNVGVRWARRKALMAGAYSVALVALVVRYGFGATQLPEGVLLVDAAIALVLGTLTAGCWWQEANARNRLSGLCQRYG
jgi:hypothetical protein